MDDKVLLSPILALILLIVITLLALFNPSMFTGFFVNSTFYVTSFILALVSLIVVLFLFAILFISERRLKEIENED